jgi:hypothetical protein
MKKASDSASAVLTIRVPQSLNRKLTQEARRQRRTRGETARALLASALEDVSVADLAEEARRQSRLASRHASEKEVLEFVLDAADVRGWE